MGRHGLRLWLAGIATVAVGALVWADSNKSAPKKPNVIVTPPSPEVIADAVRSEQDAVLRRLDVCDRLRKLGEDTNNSTLVQQADELQKQVTALYQARVARLGVKGSPKLNDAETSTIDGPAIAPAKPTERSK